MRFFKSTLVALATTTTTNLVLAQVNLGTMPECATTCLNNMQAKFGDFSCSSAEDFNCLCRASDWRTGIADCASDTCGEGSEGYQQVTAYANELCAATTGASTPAVDPTEAVAETTSTEVQETTTPQPETTSEGAGVAATTSQSTTLATSTRSSETSASTASSTSTSSTDDSDDDNHSTDESEGDSDSNDGGSVPIATKIGLGVAGGILVTVFLALGLALYHRHRVHKRERLAEDREKLQISSPMPGSGRSYASDDISAAGAVVTPKPAPKTKNGKSELEATSTRYEEMVPRTQPRLTDSRD